MASRWLLLALLAACTACGSEGGDGAVVPTDDSAVTTDSTRDALPTGDTRPADDGSPGDGTTIDTATIDTGSPGDTGADATLGPYPSGPYGNKEGDVIANLQWEGYRNDAADSVASTKPYGKYSMDDARRSGRRYALLHVSEFF